MCLKISKIFKSEKRKICKFLKWVLICIRRRDFIPVHTPLHTLTDISVSLHVKLITRVAFGEGVGDMRAT